MQQLGIFCPSCVKLSNMIPHPLSSEAPPPGQNRPRSSKLGRKKKLETQKTLNSFESFNSFFFLRLEKLFLKKLYSRSSIVCQQLPDNTTTPRLCTLVSDVHKQLLLHMWTKLCPSQTILSW